MQTTSEAPHAAGFFRWKWLGRALAYFVLLWFLLSIAGMDGLLVLPFHFFFGWIAHGIAALRHRSLSSLPHAAIFSACLVGFVSSFHLFAAWLYTARQSARGAAETQPWPLRRTLLCAGLLLTLFGAGIACIGSAHQLTWLASFDEPWVDTMHPAMRARSTAHSLRERALSENWSTAQLRQAAHARTAQHNGNLRFYVAVDKDGAWRAIVAVIGERIATVLPRSYEDSYASGRSLDETLSEFARDARPALSEPQKAGEP